jgi:sugar phosphate isomerase/epimerase
MKFRFSAFADESSNSFEEQMDALKRNGFEFLEIRNLDGKNVTELTASEARVLARTMQDNGLKVWSIGSPIGKIQIGDDFDAHMDLYRHTLDLAGEFGAKNIRLFSFFLPKDKAPEEFRSLVLERMAAFAQVAKEYGIIACHENEKGIYGDVASRCLEIHQAIPELKAVFDPANFIQCGQDTLEAWEMLGGFVHYMHVKDALPNGNVVAPGAGKGNVPTLISKYLAQGGEVLSLEPHLFEFVGLKALEQEGEESMIGALSFETAEGAFDYAANSLKKILEGIA